LSSEILSEGDWVLDVGANIGHYTIRFSELVGASGRVIAFEPVPDTFEILSSNVSVSGALNVSLVNAAASDSTRIAGVEIPMLDSGLANFYMAHLSSAPANLTVLCISVDALAIENKVRLVKIDAEGHDFVVLKGMEKLLRRHQPILFVEESTENVVDFLKEIGYSMQKLPNSPNSVFRIP